jgi:hypothetical protein
VRLRKLAVDGEKNRLDRTARTHLSFIGAPESDRLPQRYRVPRAIELVIASALHRRGAVP